MYPICILAEFLLDILASSLCPLFPTPLLDLEVKLNIVIKMNHRATVYALLSVPKYSMRSSTIVQYIKLKVLTDHSN